MTQSVRKPVFSGFDSIKTDSSFKEQVKTAMRQEQQAGTVPLSVPAAPQRPFYLKWLGLAAALVLCLALGTFGPNSLLNRRTAASAEVTAEDMAVGTQAYATKAAGIQSDDEPVTAEADADTVKQLREQYPVQDDANNSSTACYAASTLGQAYRYSGLIVVGEITSCDTQSGSLQMHVLQTIAGEETINDVTIEQGGSYLTFKVPDTSIDKKYLLFLEKSKENDQNYSIASGQWMYYVSEDELAVSCSDWSASPEDNNYKYDPNQYTGMPVSAFAEIIRNSCSEE